jgi:hypothetical protein
MDCTYFKVAEWQLLEWEQAYHPLNVQQELLKMKIWLDNNPRKRKKKYHSFATRWLSRAHASVTVAQVNARCMARAGTYDPQRPVPDYSAECGEILRRYPDLA